MKTFTRVALVCALMLSLSGCIVFTEANHGSGATAGPLRVGGSLYKEETEFNICGAGLRHRGRRGFYADAGLFIPCFNSNNELAGDDPYFIGRIGKEFDLRR